MTYVHGPRVFAASSVLVLVLGCTSSEGAPPGGGGSGSGGTGGAASGQGGTGGASAGAMSGGTGGAAAGSGGAGGATAGAGAASGSGGTVAGAAGSGATSGAGAGGTTGGSAGAGAGAGSGGEGAGGAGGGGPVGSLTNLMIEPNPKNVLSCFVSWTTDVPAASLVQFGLGGYQWEIADDALVTDHRVLVIGMRASEMYSIKAISGTLSAEGMFPTGALPATIPVGNVAISDEARIQPGWTLMNVQRVNAQQGSGVVIPNSPYPPQAVMYDSEGQPVWYHIDGTAPENGGAISTVLTDKGVLIGPAWNGQQTTGKVPREVDFAGNTVWECTHAACGPTKSVSHHAGKLSNGNYVIIEDVTTGAVKTPVFREITPQNQEVWTLDWAALVPPPSGANGDWCHGNSITVDIANNVVYANCRWVGVLKTTYQNPAVEWLLPAGCANLGLGDFTYQGSQYLDSHDPEMHSDGTILLFDNGGWTTRCAMGEYHTRIVEYQLDETTMQASLVWEFPGNFSVPDSWYTEWYSAYWGDANRLANGNVLVAGGILSATLETRVFEVSKADGVVVWELRMPNFFGVYRATRISPPLVRPIAN